ncbi:MAG TPA: hypothetical protein VL178_14840 [Pseudomonas sp.]|nr:hypothetical protein [Pseudomonas sp.]
MNPHPWAHAGFFPSTIAKLTKRIRVEVQLLNDLQQPLLQRIAALDVFPGAHHRYGGSFVVLGYRVERSRNTCEPVIKQTEIHE